MSRQLSKKALAMLEAYQATKEEAGVEAPMAPPEHVYQQDRQITEEVEVSEADHELLTDFKLELLRTSPFLEHSMPETILARLREELGMRAARELRWDIGVHLEIMTRLWEAEGLLRVETARLKALLS